MTPLEAMLEAAKAWAEADARTEAAAAREAERFRIEYGHLESEEYIEALTNRPQSPEHHELFTASFRLRNQVDSAIKRWVKSLPADGEVS